MKKRKTEHVLGRARKEVTDVQSQSLRTSTKLK